MMRGTQMLPLLLLTLSEAALSHASSLRVSVKDRTGSPFANVLLIVKSLEDGGERHRALSDASGEAPETVLRPGLYRLIATCPYGVCETQITEFLMGNDSVSLRMALDVRATTGDIVLSDRKLRVVVVGRNEQAASKAKVLVRNSDATTEKWYVADEKGGLLIDVLSEPMTLVAFYAGRLETRNLTSEDVDRLQRTKTSLTIRVAD
jgi:hypothetical protein